MATLDMPFRPATSAEVAADVDDHVRTYRGFAGALGWFAVHALIDIVGIFFLIAGHIVIGVGFIVLGTAVFATAMAGRWTHDRQADSG